MRLTFLGSGVIGLLCLFVCGCSQGPSGGKRLASERALEAIENTYKQRDDKLMFNSYMREAKGSIAMAERAGDRSRKADVQLDIDLDTCTDALAGYERSLDDTTYDALRGTLADQPERLQKEIKDEQKFLQDALPRCLNNLRKDLRY